MIQLASEFADQVGLSPNVVSTFDHPFPSAPLFVFDGHAYLYERFGDEALCINWDVAHPSERRFRYDLITDVGLMAKLPRLYHYLPGSPYAQQTFDRDALVRAGRCVDIAVEAVGRRTLRSSTDRSELRGRCLRVYALADHVASRDLPPWLHSTTLLAAQYRLLDQEDLAGWLLARTEGYFASAWCRRWIPWCIEEVTGILSFDSLRGRGTFSGRVLRGIEDDASPRSCATAIRDGLAIPSLDVFLWSAALAGIYHYGDDRGFFGRLASTEPVLARLQLTNNRNDCLRFAELGADYSVGLDYDDDAGPSLSQRRFLPSKSSRLTTLSGAYVIGGEQLSDVMDEHRHSTEMRTRTAAEPKLIELR